jgi:hypothetical protein
LTRAEKRKLLWDFNAIQAAHVKLWCSTTSELHERWQRAFQMFNEASVGDLPRCSFAT